eukprot:3459653-Lingulodinium_polyedra.AAC.1
MSWSCRGRGHFVVVVIVRWWPWSCWSWSLLSWSCRGRAWLAYMATILLTRPPTNIESHSHSPRRVIHKS